LLGSFGNNYFFWVADQWLYFWRGREWLRWNRRSPAVAHFKEAAVSVEVLAVVTGFVTVDKFEGAGIVAEGAEGDGDGGGSDGSSPTEFGIAGCRRISCSMLAFSMPQMRI
jgi:hypothetical protein